MLLTDCLFDIIDN